MDWVPEVTVGDWLRERIDDPWRGTIHDVVPRGFPAYARVFHPATRSKPVGREWPPLPQDRHRREWERFADEQPEIETLPARWADAAAAFGTTVHPLAQWSALVRARGEEWAPSDWQRATSPDGWQFDAPTEGDLDADALATLVGHVATQPGAYGYAAIWTGWGGLIGHLGTNPSRAFLRFGDAVDGPQEQRNREVLGASTKDPFNRPYAKETWQPGILSNEISRGEFLDLPGREYVVFRGDLAVLADPAWQHEVPWADTELAELGFTQFAHSPALLWPADRSWIVVTEVDWDSTIVGGPADLIAAICADPALEATPLAPDSRLQWDADEVNR
jgi:hypothetical protein